MYSDTADSHDTFSPERIRARFMMRVFLVLAVLALASLAISLAGKWFGRTIAMGGHTDDTTPFEVVIGNDVLRVPANMIRFEHARRDGVVAKLDLYMRWPQLDGYSNEARRVQPREWLARAAVPHL